MIGLGNKDKALGWGLIILSVLATTGGVLWFVSADVRIPFSFLGFTGLMFFIGILLILTDWVEHHLDIMDEIEEFPDAIPYHWEELKQRRPTRALYMWLGTLLLIGFTFYLIFKYDKWGHSLFLEIPAVMIGLIVSGVLAWVFIGTSWFQLRHHETPTWWYGIVVIGLLLSPAVGIYYTEPVEYGGPTQWQIDARGQTYDYSRTRGYTNFYVAGSSSSSSSSSSYSGFDFDFDCDEDVCIGIIIVIIVVVLVIASATTPHFWVTAIIILAVLLFIISIREIYPIRSTIPKGIPKNKPSE